MHQTLLSGYFREELKQRTGGKPCSGKAPWGSYSVTRSVFDLGPAAMSAIRQIPLFFLTLSVLGLHGFMGFSLSVV